MNCEPLPSSPPVTGPSIWPSLPSDLQQRAVRLLAQLAYARFRYHLALSTQESDHGYRSTLPQGSSRPS
jgi:hypothetical protein